MIVYKYQTINKNSLSGIIQRKLWCPKPSELNDPFEVNIIEFNDISQNHFRRQMDDFGVMSFTEDNYNLLMWAHYGDNHKGICLGFDVGKEPNHLFKVEYSDTYPTIDPNQKETFVKVLLTKSTHWGYERELRMITSKVNCLYSYPGRLVEVCFGARILKSDIEVIKSILKNENIIYKQAFLHPVEFKVVYDL